MSNIIQFKPTQSQQTRQIQQPRQAQAEYCSCEFCDEILDDIVLSKPKKTKSHTLRGEF